MSLDLRSYPVLYVDDDRANLLAVQYALEDTFRIDIATSGEEALRMLERERYAVLLADQRMPGMTGVDLCERARTLCPDTLRIILTAYADLHAVVDAVNRGQVLRWLEKPIRNEELEDVLRASIELVHAARSVRELQESLLRGGAGAGARAASREVASGLGERVVRLRRLVEHARDLTHAAHRSSDEAHRKALLAELERTQGDVLLSVGELEALQRDLSALSPARRPPTLDLSRAVDSTVRLIRTQLAPTTRLTVQVDATPQVRIDPGDLAQVLSHLLTNAAQAVQELDRGEIRVVVDEDDGWARVRVEDTGHGISPEVLPRIFDPQFTTRPGAAGLGLAISRHLAEASGGQLEAERPAVGAAFRLELPRSDAVEESGEYVRGGGLP